MNKIDRDDACRKINQKKNRPSWLLNVLIAIDQFGNALAGGNPKATISARTGFFAAKDNSPAQNYWKLLEKAIDFSFHPLDGEGHSRKQTLKEDRKHFQGNDLMRGILGLLVIAASIPISITTRIWVIINPCAHYSRKISTES